MPIDTTKEKTRKLAHSHLDHGDPTGWFEALYAASEGDADQVPWAELEPKRFLVEWAEGTGLRGEGQCALVVGCGLGDDAAFLSSLGFSVTGFDLSPTAIAWAKRRFPDRGIDFQVGNLFAPPTEWSRGFDFVLEIYTVQALPPELHPQATDQVTEFVASGGKLLVISQGPFKDQPPPNPPWPLTAQEVDRFQATGLAEITREHWIDEAVAPPTGRWRILLGRPT